MHAIALIPLMEVDVLIPSIFVKSLIFGFVEDGSSFATLPVAFLENVFFRLKTCCLVSFSPSVRMKKNSSSSVTSERDVFTSIGVVCVSSRILRRTFSVIFTSNKEKNSAAVLTQAPKLLFQNYITTHNHKLFTATVE